MKLKLESCYVGKRSAQTRISGSLSLAVLFTSMIFAQSSVASTANSSQVQRPASQPGNSSLVRDAATLLEAGRLEEAEATARRVASASAQRS